MWDDDMAGVFEFLLRCSWHCGCARNRDRRERRSNRIGPISTRAVLRRLGGAIAPKMPVRKADAVGAGDIRDWSGRE
jgi:hypothetical protein